MKSAFIASLATLVLLTALPASARPTAGNEDGHELDPSMITLPSIGEGTVAVQICSACKRLTYTLNLKTQFFVGKQLVSYGEFKRYVDTHPNALVHLVRPVNESIVTRLSAQ